MDAHALIQSALERLSQKSGYRSRPLQEHLVHLISDCIAGKMSSAIEAPTGLGKSLAALIPAIAHGLHSKKRTIIATYTNILAEQYWAQDLPTALGLFDTSDSLKTAFLIGKQRYLCLEAIRPISLKDALNFSEPGLRGLEHEWMELCSLPKKTRRELLPQVMVPPVCAGKECPSFQVCRYFNARKAAETAQVVITNHSVVLQHCLMVAADPDSKGLLGKFDHLILDEAHDFHSAAVAGLEFELSESKLQMILGIMGRLRRDMMRVAEKYHRVPQLMEVFQDFESDIDGVRRGLKALSIENYREGILEVSPTELAENPGVKNSTQSSMRPSTIQIAEQAAGAVRDVTSKLQRELELYETTPSVVSETWRSTQLYAQEFETQCAQLHSPLGVAVTSLKRFRDQVSLRLDTVDVAEPLKEILWDKFDVTCLSATLAVDTRFEYFCDLIGADPSVQEVLPSPFDFASQAAVYLPAAGRVPDPTEARKSGTETIYWDAIARELRLIIEALGGRTLALFHSRKEMEAVYERMPVNPEFPILMQSWSNSASSRAQFLRQKEASLFGLRSFWTGFDAPGDTCACVALVRVPFEVPVEPSSIVRAAHMISAGKQPFRDFALPQAKMLVRQGAGRLIRREEDRGVIAILDSRLRTKNYGQEFLENLPQGMRTFDDFIEAAAWTQIAE